MEDTAKQEKSYRDVEREHERLGMATMALLIVKAMGGANVSAGMVEHTLQTVRECVAKLEELLPAPKRPSSEDEERHYKRRELEHRALGWLLDAHKRGLRDAGIPAAELEIIVKAAEELEAR